MGRRVCSKKAKESAEESFFVGYTHACTFLLFPPQIIHTQYSQHSVQHFSLKSFAICLSVIHLVRLNEQFASNVQQQQDTVRVGAGD